MISIEEQQTLLLNVSRKLKNKIIVYAVGGTAMMFSGLKESTLDIDLVFENEKDRDEFRKAAIELGYRKMDAIAVYGAKNNAPQMLKLDNERFDLFVSEVIDFVFSENMKKRAVNMHQFEDKLILKIADFHDLILMKCATDRQKDADDARRIISMTKINWDILVSEAKNQVALGKEKAVFDLGCFLEKLKNELGVKVPSSVLDELFKTVKKQAERKIH